MESKWQRRRILIWGKTRPELSQKYRETVCTGGVFEDNRKLVRLYPIPLRYIDDERVFKKYQWIEAYVTRATSDPRPESYKIRYDGIETFEVIPTNKGNWNDRAPWITHEGNIVQSVEVLQARQQIDHTSLGLVKPLEVISVTSHRYSQEERDGYWAHYKEALSQMDLPLDQETGREIRPLTPPDYRFRIRFRCNDERCDSDHKFSVLDWETDALYFKLRQQGDPPDIAAEKVVDKIRNQVCAPDKDLYFFLGNISTHPHIFTVVGFWWPKKQRGSEPVEQPRLF
jgi:hypothetical protein